MGIHTVEEPEFLVDGCRLQPCIVAEVLLNLALKVLVRFIFGLGNHQCDTLSLMLRVLWWLLHGWLWGLIDWRERQQ